MRAYFGYAEICLTSFYPSFSYVNRKSSSFEYRCGLHVYIVDLIGVQNFLRRADTLASFAWISKPCAILAHEYRVCADRLRRVFVHVPDQYVCRQCEDKNAAYER